MTSTTQGKSGAASIPDEYKVGGFALGCQAFTFHRFSAFESIEKTAQAGARTIEFYPGHKLSPEDPDLQLHHDASDEVIARLQDKLQQHGVLMVNYGVVELPNDEAQCRSVFDFARKMSIGIITSEPAEDAFDTLEKLVQEYDIKLAVHNHARRANYKHWDPNWVLSMLKDRDPRMGACADTGHWARSEIKAVEALQILEGRIISSHLKDLNKFALDGHDVPFGEGVCNVKGALDELSRQGFAGNIAIEYEYNWDNSVPDVAQCVGFIRGYGASRAKS